MCCIGPLFRLWVFDEVRLIYDVFQNFMIGSHHALELLREMSSVDQEDIHRVIEESLRHQEIVRDELVNIRAGYPAIMK